jgi:hypothetical protein
MRRRQVFVLLATTTIRVAARAEGPPPDSTSATATPPVATALPALPVPDITCTCDPILLAQRGFSCNGMCGGDCSKFYLDAMGLAQAPECSWSRVSLDS